jgi:hypothetical protein
MTRYGKNAGAVVSRKIQIDEQKVERVLALCSLTHCLNGFFTILRHDEIVVEALAIQRPANKEHITWVVFCNQKVESSVSQTSSLFLSIPAQGLTVK